MFCSLEGNRIDVGVNIIVCKIYWSLILILIFMSDVICFIYSNYTISPMVSVQNGDH